MQRLETERLIIRRVSEDDYADVFEILSNPRVDCFISETTATLDEAIEETKKRAQSEAFYAVETKDGGKMIGFIYMEKGEHGNYDIGWNFNQKFEGKGMAYESVHALMDAAFSADARRFVVYTADTNLRSQHLCERLGMRKEGNLIECISFTNESDGQPRYESAFTYAILKKEWK